MSAALVFNHHSLPITERQMVSEAVQALLQICLEAHGLGYSLIRMDAEVDSSWFRIELSEGYFWKDWYDAAIREPTMKDQVTAFRQIQTRSPFLLEGVEGEDVGLFEVNIEGLNQEFSAVTAAAWFDSPLVGFRTRDPWNRNPIQVRIASIDAMVSDEVAYRTKEISNFHSRSAWENAKLVLQQKRLEAFKGGTELWASRKTLFPHLEFCGKVLSQIPGWQHSPDSLDKVKSVLVALDRFTSKWRDGIYPDFHGSYVVSEGLSSRISGESESVRTNPSLKRLRQFYLPDGRCELFELHVKLGGIRIHFFPDMISRTIYIGYAGTHLPTRKF